MSLGRLPTALLIAGMLPGLLGAMLGFAASNMWFYYFAAYLIPGIPGRTLMPDFFTYLQIDAFIGAGCGYAGSITGPNIAGLLGSKHGLGPFIPALYTAILGATVVLIANAVLLLMSSL